MKSGLLIKIAMVAALIAGGCIYFLNTLKPVAIVAEASRSTAVQSVPGVVKVKAAKEMFLRCEESGRIVESALELGKKVEEGEVLLSLDTGDLDLALEKIEIEIEAVNLVLEEGSSRQFNLITANERLAEVEENFRRGMASKSDVELRERSIKELEQAIDNEIRVQKVRLAQLENELKVYARKREKMSVRSPIAGVITQVAAYKGDLIRSGQEVATVISLDRIVEVKVSEENFSEIELGQLARVKLLGYNNRAFDGRVSKILPVADEGTQRYTVHVDLDIEPEKLFPGLTGESTITLDERKDAIIVPGTAIVGDKVLLVSNGIVSVKRIEKGFGSMTNVEILSGLSEGDLVIVDKLELFKDGDRVRTSLKAL